jgi:aminopeptidase N
MSKLVASGLALLLTLPAWADGPYVFEHTVGRLPKDVVPTDYELSLVPDLDKKQFSGHETVHLEVRSRTRTIQFDSEDETLSDVRFDGRPLSQVATDNAQQLTTLTLPTTASVGRHVLTFSYTGVIRDDVRGLFSLPFKQGDGKPSRYLSSNFEPTDARMMFPGWDEPAFRARFKISIDVPADWAAISNMPIEHRVVHGDTATVTFERSPRIPTYLVHVTSGDFVRLAAQAGATDVGVWTIRGREADGKIALGNTQEILNDYNSYFGYPFPLPKLDGIAIPGGFSGGMENWGAIAYTDRALLITPASSLGDRQAVYSVMAHEMAHQWNGDLVTMAWWDDLWLNESFASFMSAHETANRHPDWQWWEGQDRDKETAMSSDGNLHSHAIHEPVPDEAAANVASDSDIIYSKGQAMLRMFEAYLGPEVFRDGVRRLMKKRAFSNATGEDLWDALSAASGKDIKALAADWTEQPGFPLVNVTASCAADGQRTLLLTQERFLDTGTDPKHEHWNIPLQVRLGAHGTAQSQLFSGQSQSLPAGRCDEPVSVNADTLGFYRVHYDAATLANDTRDFDKLPVADRLALLDDEWALVRKGSEPLANYFKLASNMGDAMDARAWQQIANALDSVATDEVGTSGYGAYLAFARSLLKPAARQLGWQQRADDTPAISSLRRTLLTRLGAWGDAEVIAEARRQFALFLKDPSSIAADDQTMVFDIVAGNADQATFDQLHEIARSAKDPALLEHAYLALARVADARLASQVLTLALSAEIPPQANDLPYSMTFLVAHLHPELSWQSFHTTDKDLFSQYGPEAPVLIAQYVPQTYWEAAPLTDLEAWLSTHVPKELDSAKEHYLEWARLRLAERAALVPAADEYVRQLK